MEKTTTVPQTRTAPEIKQAPEMMSAAFDEFMEAFEARRRTTAGSASSSTS